jgi:hypothetical protein
VLGCGVGGIETERGVRHVSACIGELSPSGRASGFLRFTTYEAVRQPRLRFESTPRREVYTGSYGDKMLQLMRHTSL